MFLMPSSCATGKVLEGKYKKCIIQWYNKDIKIHTGFFQRLPLNSETIESYEVIAEDNSKSANSVIGRGLLGGLLFGGVGALVGGYTAKSNGMVVEVNFKDGSSSILLLPQDFYLKLVYDFKQKNKKVEGESSEKEKVVLNTNTPFRKFLGICCGLFALLMLSYTFSEENTSIGFSLTLVLLFSFWAYRLWKK